MEQRAWHHFFLLHCTFLAVSSMISDVLRGTVSVTLLFGEVFQSFLQRTLLFPLFFTLIFYVV